MFQSTTEKVASAISTLPTANGHRGRLLSAAWSVGWGEEVSSGMGLTQRVATRCYRPFRARRPMNSGELQHGNILELCSHDDPLPGRSSRMASEQRQHGGVCLLDNPNVVGSDDDRLAHNVFGRPAIESRNGDRVTRLQAIEVAKRRRLGGPVTGQNHVAEPSRLGSPCPVGNTPVDHREVDAFSDRLPAAGGRYREPTDRDPQLLGCRLDMSPPRQGDGAGDGRRGRNDAGKVIMNAR